MRLGGVAMMAAGFLGLVASALFVVAALRAPEDSFSYAPDGLFVAAAFLQELPKSVLLCAGLLGLCVLLYMEPGPVRRMALAGVALFSLGLVFPLVLLLGQALGSEATSELQLWEALFIVTSVSPSVGIALCGVAAFWARGLGRWRILPLVVGVLDSPLSNWVVFAIVRSSLQPPVVPYADTRWMETALQVPVLLTGVGWILVGRLLYGARDRENALIAARHRALSEENRSKARRLYEEAWTMDKLSALDELVAEDLLDYEHDRFGREEFKKTIVDLHRTFPDLTLSIEAQDAKGDTVMTRCAFSGTDRGGVLWYPPTGKHATFAGAFTDRFAEGRLAEHRGGIDMADLLEQLGLSSTEKQEAES